MAGLKAVIFDNDGTIADTHDMILASFIHATEEVLGKALPEDVLMEKVGIPLADQMKDFSDDPEVQEKLLKSYRSYNHKIHDEMIAKFPGEDEALSELNSMGLKMAVVTSKRHWLAARGLEVLGIEKYFEFLIGADDCEGHKPGPEPVLACVDKLGLSPAECAYVGDSPFDIMAANAAGCMSIGVIWGMFNREKLKPERPDAICSNFQELVETVRGAL
ncbi:MAG: HAD family hydrolase [Coriobacteriales bacterium]|jgi:pyrophosphatase PpaX